MHEKLKEAKEEAIKQVGSEPKEISYKEKDYDNPSVKGKIQLTWSFTTYYDLSFIGEIQDAGYRDVELCFLTWRAKPATNSLQTVSSDINFNGDFPQLEDFVSDFRYQMEQKLKRYQKALDGLEEF